MKKLLLAMALLGVPVLAFAQTRTFTTYTGAYASGTTYNINDMVSSAGITYVSLISGNVGNTPSSSPSDWAIVGVQSGSGTGTVTSFSAGNLSPLFTTSTATSTTTPALSFSLSNAAADTVLGNPTGSSAAPSFTASPVLTAVTAATITDSGLTSGNCVQAGTGGLLTTTGSACGAGGSGTTTNALTLNNGGSGAASGSTFNGSAAVTLSYNTLGAAGLAASNTFTGTTNTFAAIVGSNVTDSALTSGQCVQAGTGGLLTTTGSACGSGSGSSAWSAITAGANTATGAFSTTAPWTFSYSGTASTPGITISGAPYTAGTATTDFPQFYLNSGTAPTTWSNGGTIFGMNSPSGFTGNFIDIHSNGGASLFSIDNTGNINMNGNAGASNPALELFGNLYTGGTGTTTTPSVFLQPSSATAATTWSTNGTGLGMNLASGFSGNFLDFRVNGGSSLFNVSNVGAVATPSVSTTGASNGSVTLTYTGTAASAPGTNQVQISPATSITTPYSISPAAAGSTGLAYGTYNAGSAVEQMTYTNSPSVSNLTDTSLSAGQCVQAGTGGLLTTTGAACGSGGSTAWSGITAGANTATGAFSTAGQWTFSGAGTTSTPAIAYTGEPFAGGTGTTTEPYILYQTPSATAATAWSTNGTILGMNVDSGFNGNLIDLRKNGGASAFYIAPSGNIGINHLDQTGTNQVAGTCTISSSTTCTSTLAAAFVSTPLCIVSVYGTSPGNTVACSVSGTTVTITANASTSLVADWIVIGNPN